MAQTFYFLEFSRFNPFILSSFHILQLVTLSSRAFLPASPLYSFPWFLSHVEINYKISPISRNCQRDPLLVFFLHFADLPHPLFAYKYQGSPLILHTTSFALFLSIYTRHPLFFLITKITT